ncbi:hypothetical protein LPJ61_004181 [Coemansia biformis]|uniref:Uncharacterized protein n=1 Tax=Coemansia biformis TaxID=1286918 RepID=A0A9W8CX04_9FUNG|nr:hypothetical protein LPJ61_004181 [Coemansia biformis]
MRKSRRESAGLGDAVAGPRSGARGVARPASPTAHAYSSGRQSPDRLGAIPATQLDVLALVTATSPPMPSRRRWAGRSTPKPAYGHGEQTPVPVRSDLRGAATPRLDSANGRANGRHDSGSDTVSEDELTLRSYSSRQRARHQSVNLRPLPASMPGLRQVASARVSRTRRPAVHGERRHSGSRSGGDTTETDEEMSSHAQTPVPRRVAMPHGHALAPLYADRESHAPAAAPGRTPGRPAGLGPLEGDWDRALPASEPAMHRRSRRRLHGGARGIVLSKQLSGLTEEVEEPEGRPGMANETRDSSVSLTPSPSRHRQEQHARSARSRTRAQASGSETETDAELPSRAHGSETESETTNTASSGAYPGSDRGHSRGRVHGGAVNSRQGRAATVSAPHGHRHYQLPPIFPVNGVGGGQQQQQQQRRGEPPALNGGEMEVDSDGETTETDDDFFGQSHAVHASIRPPRRVVQQLASLRARHPHPVALDLNGSRPLVHSAHSGRGIGDTMLCASAAGHLPRTAPASGLGADDGERGLGLGISSEASRQRNGSARNLSTPSSTAAAAALAAVAAGGTVQERQGRPLEGGGDIYRGFIRGPLGPGGGEFTFHGAALRRLERSHGRVQPGGAGAGSANRKRALTAPSSLEPPMSGRSAYGPGGRVLTSAESLLEDAGETANGYCTPPEHGRHLGARSSFLGESPVSSLRSSLLVRAQRPEQPPLAAPAHGTPPMAANGAGPSTSAAATDTSAGDEPAGVLSGPGSPSMDAVLRQNRKRIRSPSLVATPTEASPQPVATPSPPARRRLDEAAADRSSGSGGRARSPPPEVLFPPIDRGNS